MSNLTQLQEDFKNLPSDERKHYFTYLGKDLSINELHEVIQKLSISPPDTPTTNRIWILMISAFLIVLIGAFLTLAYFLAKGIEAGPVLTVFTTVTAFIGGLFAPSPVGLKQ